MSLPAVIFDGNTLSFPEQATGFRHRARTRRVQHTSQGAQTERFFRWTRDEIRVTLARYGDEDFRNDLEAFFAWSSAGNEFDFAFDNADKIDVTLAAAAIKGATSVTVSSDPGIVVGNFYRLKNEGGGPNVEIIEVSSVASSPVINLVNPTKFAYSIGDFFRSRYFYPNMILSEDVQRFFNQLNITTWTFELDAIENIS